jgi:hypothetical protein
MDLIGSSLCTNIGTNIAEQVGRRKLAARAAEAGKVPRAHVALRPAVVDFQESPTTNCEAFWLLLVLPKELRI